MVFEDADCGFVDRVVCNYVVVASDEDAGLGAVENVIETDARLVALEANAIENGGGESLVAVDHGIAAVNEDIDLADPSGVAGYVDSVGLRYKDVCSHSGAGVGSRTRRPNIVGDHII